MDGIKFVNGSKMRVLDGSSNSPNAPMMIFAIDMTNPDSEDLSCISYPCSKCKTIFHSDYFRNGEYCSPELYTKCPSCGTRFKGWIHNC